MATEQGSLTILDAHVAGEAKVFWNGALVPNVVAVTVDADSDSHRVVSG